MNIKPFPNHKVYIQTIRAMGPEKRLLKAFELSEFSKELFREVKDYANVSPNSLVGNSKNYI